MFNALDSNDGFGWRRIDARPTFFLKHILNAKRGAEYPLIPSCRIIDRDGNRMKFGGAETLERTDSTGIGNDG